MTNIQKAVAEEKIPGIDSIIHDLELCCAPWCNCKDFSRNKLPKEVDCAIYLCIDALEALKKARELLAEKPSQASNSTDENETDEKTSNKLIKEVRMMKALIAYSGPQTNRSELTPGAIQRMHGDRNEGKRLFRSAPTFDAEERPCGYLNKTELQYNKELHRVELWGYFTYAPEEAKIEPNTRCSYTIAYRHENMDADARIHKCDLVDCFLTTDPDE